jgi:hypothetical protein
VPGRRLEAGGFGVEDDLASHEQVLRRSGRRFQLRTLAGPPQSEAWDHSPQGER